MTIIEGLLTAILIVLIIIGLLSFSAVKGIGSILEQQGNIFTKHSEWMADIYDVIFGIKEEQKIVIGEEENPQRQKLYEDGLKKFDMK